MALVRPTSVAVSRAEVESPEMTIDAGDVDGVLCGHEVHMRVTWDSEEPWRLIMIEFHDEDEEQP